MPEETSIPAGFHALYILFAPEQRRTYAVGTRRHRHEDSGPVAARRVAVHRRGCRSGRRFAVAVLAPHSTAAGRRIHQGHGRHRRLPQARLQHVHLRSSENGPSHGRRAQGVSPADRRYSRDHRVLRRLRRHRCAHENSGARRDVVSGIHVLGAHETPRSAGCSFHHDSVGSEEHERHSIEDTEVPLMPIRVTPIRTMRRVAPALCVGALFFAPVMAAAQSDIAPLLSGDERIIVRTHQIATPAGTLKYESRAGRLPIRNDENGEIRGYIFFVAYTAKTRTPGRPITFLWNGGPTANSLLVHTELFGPRRFDHDRLVDNAETL